MHNYLTIQIEKFKSKLCIKRMRNCISAENIKYLKMLSNNEELPTGVKQYVNRDGYLQNRFYVTEENGLSEDEEKLLLELIKISHIATIKDCIVFMTVLIVLGLIAAFIIIVLMPYTPLMLFNKR